MNLTEADRIWNRACGQDPLRTHSGDRALADLLVAHGLTMNGGVLHAVECLTEDEMLDVEAGYRFYGLDQVAAIFTHARRLVDTDEDLDDYEATLDQEYADIIPDDTSLIKRFEKHLKENPSEYAPLREDD
ncbi:hypothetical protein JXQ70_17180 [bacterium]|nr:hypothetical protein [bacterium]